MLIELNERQRRAIEHVHGPMLVLAGAGTGKTTVLTKRIARLIADRHARPDEILAITYTENAAAEMCKRVEEEVGKRCVLRASTFHAYCFEMLQRCGHGFRVIDRKDLWVYLRLRLEELPLEHFRPARNPGEFLDALLSFFERCHDELITPDKYDAFVEHVRHGEVPPPRISKTKEMDDLSQADVVARCEEIARVFRTVEDMLRAENLGSFGHMIGGAIALLRRDPALLARERERARFMLIDEFQDANVSQIELAELLAGEEQNVFAVGDPDQAIYRFRGASSAAFDEFRRRFPRARAVVLNQNQRSTSKILDASFAVIAQNPPVACVLDGVEFHREHLQSAREQRARKKGNPLAPEPVEIVLAAPELESADVARAVEALYRTEGDALDCAVLYRQHAHRAELARELRERSVPFVVHGLDALNTGEVRDALACLGAIESERDSASLFRVASLAVFGLDGARVREELRLAGREADMWAALAKVPGGERMLATLGSVRAQARAVDLRADAALELAMRHFHLPLTQPLAALRNFVDEWTRKPITCTGRLAEFLRYLEYFQEAGGGIELPESERESHAVRLMTVHAAKGLEFAHVFVLRSTSGSFPATYREALFEFPPGLREISQEELDDREIHKQEERRLFYVAMTRARDRLTLCAKPGRSRRDNTPPGFLRELMGDVTARTTWRSRPADATVTIHAGAAHAVSRLGEWLLAPPSLPLDGVVLSATAIEIYRECPLQYKIRREWNVPGEIAAGLHYGNAVHTALKDFYDALLAGRPRSEEELLACFQQALATMRFEDDLQRRLYEAQGLKQLAEFFVRQQAAPTPDVLHTERTFEVAVAGVRVRGRIDRLDRIEGQRVAITDYKTGTPRKPDEANASLQLSIYALACREWKLTAESLSFYNLETNEAVSTTRTAAQLEETVTDVRAVAEGIAAGVFDPAPGYHCRRCVYREICPQTEELIH